MIELDEKDIRAIGYSRYMRENGKCFVGIFIAGVGGAIGLGFLGERLSVNWLPAIPMCVFMWWYWRFMKRSGKAERSVSVP